MPLDLEDFARSELQKLWRQRSGSETEVDLYRYLYLDIWPPSLQLERAEDIRTRRTMKACLYDGNHEVGRLKGLKRRNGKPTVYVTFGTVHNWTMPSLASAANTLSDSINFVITTGPNRDAGHYRRIAPDVKVYDYLPHTAVFPHCDLVITHGGSGTILGALAHGLPMLIMPQGADNYLNARQCVAAGVGRWLDQTGLTAHTLHGEILELLERNVYRDNARRLQSEIMGMPTPDSLVPVLEDLAHNGRKKARANLP